MIAGLAPALAAWAAGDLTPDAFHTAFADATLYVRRTETHEGHPAVAALGEPGTGWVTVYSSPMTLAAHAGECDWAGAPGRDLVAQVPAGYGLVVDPAGPHPAVLPATALRRCVVISRDAR